MGFADKYIVQLGTATESLMAAVLFKILNARYAQEYGSERASDFVVSLAACVTNMVLSHKPSNEEGATFFEIHRSLVMDRARELSNDRSLCTLLSGAAYNMSYAEFLLKGGRRGLFSNPFLGFVRALSQSYAAEGDQALEAYGVWRSYQDALGDQRDSVRPLLNLHNLGLFVAIDHSPNEKEYYEAVVSRARKVGLG